MHKFIIHGLYRQRVAMAIPDILRCYKVWHLVPVSELIKGVNNMLVW